MVYRELKTRISQVRFGFIGVMIEPLAVIIVFLAIFGFLRAGNGGPLDITLFLAAGIITYTLFKDIAIRSMGAMDANEALFFYRPVKPGDTVIARSIVETGLYSLVLLIITVGIWIMQRQVIMSNFIQLASSFILLAMTAMGFGLVFMVLGFRFPFSKQILQMLMRPLLFISGIFYSIQAIPQQFRPWLTWNPILQSIELSRNAYSGTYAIDSSISMGYLALCALVSCAVGFGVYINNERILLTR